MLSIRYTFLSVSARGPKVNGIVYSIGGFNQPSGLMCYDLDLRLHGSQSIDFCSRTGCSAVDVYRLELHGREVKRLVTRRRRWSQRRRQDRKAW
ncbi:hypothetical protein PsYK624_095680 [Phanerochaete sordida]|uniref:Uncharacterized protein n=1 Tax=Phanerochaete sordida TaxID=48140 RepID=A0A9P3GGV9_9APHY|nr:hypothetical protein PsYK624_095680 [Phanerochaete sordida]